MIRLHARDAKTLDDPLAEALSDLLPLWIGAFAALGALGIVEQWQAGLRTDFDEVEEALLNQMRVHRDNALVVALRHFGTKVDA